MPEKEFRYFTANHGRLFERYPDEYLFIKGERVLHHGKDFRAAIEWAEGHGLENGEFMVQLCGEGKDCYTQTFRSRARF